MAALKLSTKLFTAGPEISINGFGNTPKIKIAAHKMINTAFSDPSNGAKDAVIEFVSPNITDW